MHYFRARIPSRESYQKGFHRKQGGARELLGKEKKELLLGLLLKRGLGVGDRIHVTGHLTGACLENSRLVDCVSGRG